jgi:hypothetical protein
MRVGPVARIWNRVIDPLTRMKKMSSQRFESAKLLDRGIPTMARSGSECWPKSDSSRLLRFI